MKMTIIEAVKNVLADDKEMSSREIYEKIIEKNCMNSRQRILRQLLME